MKYVLAIAVGAFAVAGCEVRDRSQPMTQGPVVEPVPAPAQPDQPSAGVGGGPPTAAARDGWARDVAIDRLANARCSARERCGYVGLLKEHASYFECVEQARIDLRASFGAQSCDNYDEDKLSGCARKASDAACGSENSLSEDCAESKLCR
jgi:hypothetical protein